MPPELRKVDIIREIEVLLRRVRDAILAGGSKVSPVKVPLGDREILTIHSNIDDFEKNTNITSVNLPKNIQLVFRYTIPKEVSNSEPRGSYLEEVYESKKLDTVKRAIAEYFEMEIGKISFISSEVTSTSVSFGTSVFLDSPQSLPTDEDKEIVKVISLDINEKYIYKSESEPLGYPGDILLDSGEEIGESKTPSIGDTIEILGNEFILELEEDNSLVLKENSNSQSPEARVKSVSSLAPLNCSR